MVSQQLVKPSGAIKISHTHPTVEDRAALLAALYRACLRSLRANG